MAGYRDARAAIATIIDAVNITVPVAASIVKVYETKPAQEALNEFPSVVITGATITPSRSSGLRERTYGVGLQLLVRPIDGAETQDLLDAFKEAIIAAFDGALTLDGTAFRVLSGPNWLNKEPFFDSAGAMWEEGEIVIKIDDAPGFGS